MNVASRPSCSRPRRTATRIFTSISAVVAGFAAWLLPASAWADRDDDDYGGRREPNEHLNVGFDVEGAIPTSMPRFVSGNTLSSGGGFKVRVGDQFRMAGLRVIPDGGYAF